MRYFRYSIFICLMLVMSLPMTVLADETNQDTPKEVVVINRVLGGLEGIDNDTFDGGDGTGVGQVALKVIQLQLHKKSFGLTSNGKMEEKPLPQNSKVVLGQELFFTLYVDNLTDAELYNMILFDMIDEKAFSYIPNSLESAITDANSIAKEVDFTKKLSDQVDGDFVSIVDSPNSPKGKDKLVIGQTRDTQNGVLSVAPGKRLTIRFKVQIQ